MWGRGKLVEKIQQLRELSRENIFLLTDEELRRHIAALQTERNRLSPNVVESVSECNFMLQVSCSELASRDTKTLADASLKLARSSYILSIVSTTIAIAGIFVSAL
jgi:hypothetical protein